MWYANFAILKVILFEVSSFEILLIFDKTYTILKFVGAEWREIDNLKLNFLDE